MKALEDSVRSVEMEGLVWGASKLVAIGYGIRKLQITLVVGLSLACLQRTLVDNLVQRTNSYHLTISKRRLPNLRIMFRVLMLLPCRVGVTFSIGLNMGLITLPPEL